MTKEAVIKLDDKYYIPYAHELSVGQGYELLNGEKWEQYTFPLILEEFRHYFKSIQGIEQLIENGLIRVKKIDENDIIELGWIQINNSQFYRHFVLKSGANPGTLSIIKLRKDGEKIYIGYDKPYMGSGLFYGNIYNAKDLQKIMMALDIMEYEMPIELKKSTNRL